MSSERVSTRAGQEGGAGRRLPRTELVILRESLLCLARLRRRESARVAEGSSCRFVGHALESDSHFDRDLGNCVDRIFEETATCDIGDRLERGSSCRGRLDR